jgi:hypothetical protein
MPRLYNLDSDLGETTDVSAVHPEVVKRLQDLAARMDADLGATRQGPGVRPPGRVNDPQPLLFTPSLVLWSPSPASNLLRALIVAVILSLLPYCLGHRVGRFRVPTAPEQR